MRVIKTLWSKPAPYTYKQVSICVEGRSWLHWQNWKFQWIWGRRIIIITPFLRLLKNNGSIQFGLGNIFLWWGW